MGNTESNNTNRKLNGGDAGKFLDKMHKTDNDFQIKDGRVYIKRNNKLTGFVAFYAPWCHYCKILAPSWNQYSTDMKKSSFNFFTVDCTDKNCSNIVSALNIRGYPTIKYIEPKTGEIVAAEYKDGTLLERSKEGIARFLKEKSVM
jgi:thiol-disulfide isomerase/thioredoxin